MAAKDITIRIQAAGGDQAAAEIKQVENAAGNLKQSTSESSKSVEGIGAKSNLAGAAMIGAAVGGKILSEQIGKIKEAIESIDIENLRAMSPVMADQVEEAKRWSELFSDPLSGIQRMISGSTISEAFAAANEQLALNVESQRQAVDRLIENGKYTADQLKDLAAKFKAANDVLNAQQDAASKRRDVEDAARIRAGEDPDMVAKDRAVFDRDQALDRINREQAGEIDKLNRLLSNSETANANAAAVAADPRATPDDLAKAATKASEAAVAYEQARDNYQRSAAIADARREGVRADYDKAVGDADFSLNRKQQEAEARRLAAAREAEEERLAEQKRKDSLRLADAQVNMGVARLGADERRDPAKVGEAAAVSQALRGFSQQLKEADTVEEVEAAKQSIIEAQKVLGQRVASILIQMANDQAATIRRLDALEQQIKNNRK